MGETAPTTAPRRKRDMESRSDRIKLAPRPRGGFPKIMGAFEAAQALDVKTTNLQYIKDLPEPVFEVKATRIWLAKDIEQFAKVYNKRRQARQTRQVA